MKRLIGIALTAVVGFGIVTAPVPARAQVDENIDKVEYQGGLLTKEEAEAELARNEKLLALLIRCGVELKREATTADHSDLSFMQDYLQVCDYLLLALESFKTYIAERNELDRKLFERYLLKGEQAITRLLQSS